MDSKSHSASDHSEEVRNAHLEAHYIASGIKSFQTDKARIKLLSEPFKGLIEALIDTKDIYQDYIDAVEDGKAKE